MKTLLIRLFALSFASLWPLLPPPAFAAEWEPAEAPLMSPWAADIDPNNVLPEYPRPTLVRPDWLNLNGVWEFSPATATDPLPVGQTLAESILVPFAWESALSGIRRQIPTHRAVYRRTFEIPIAWSGQRVLLNFGAVDWEATVHLNGRFAGQHRGGFDDFTFDITPLLNDSGTQELIVEVFDPTNDAAIAVGKQNLAKFSDPGRYTYSSVSGIWQTVWIEPVPTRHIAAIHTDPDIDRSTLDVTVNPDVLDEALTAVVIAKIGDTEIGRATGAINVPLTVPVPNARLWWPDDPFLYDLEVHLMREDEIIDTITSYFGMRKISLMPVMENGRGPVQKLALNHTFIFQMGPLDQGYWPDGLYTAPTDAALKWEVDQIKDWGFNMIRKHIKIEPERWFYHCDRAGVLVWQDMPSTFKKRSDEDKAQFEAELARMVRANWNHPSIINWIVFNEHWGAYDVVRLTEFVMELDPDRLVTGNSGIDAGRPDVDYQVGHIKDNHSYRPPHAPHPPHNRAVVNGEYGAIGYKIPGHIWDVDGDWVHHNYEGKEAATAEYVKFIDQLLEYRDQDALSGAVYTQWTDLENEMNGLLTYDRKVEKLERATVTAANLSLWQEALATAPRRSTQSGSGLPARPNLGPDGTPSSTGGENATDGGPDTIN